MDGGRRRAAVRVGTFARASADETGPLTPGSEPAYLHIETESQLQQVLAGCGILGNRRIVSEPHEHGPTYCPAARRPRRHADPRARGTAAGLFARQAPAHDAGAPLGAARRPVARGAF